MIPKPKLCVPLQVFLVASMAWILDCGWCRANSGSTLDTEAGGYVPSELLVKCAERTTEQQRQTMHDMVGATVVRTFDLIGWQHVRLPDGMSTQRGLQAYLRTPGVAAAEVNGTYAMFSAPNDPMFPQQWALSRIQAETAWDTCTGSGDVVVAVIGTGIQYDHPDLEGNMWRNPGEVAGNGIDDDGNGYADDVYGIDTGVGDSDPRDFVGHGTMVAGIIGARGNNGLGVVGVNWSVNLMALKVGGDSIAAGTTAGILEAYEYVIALKRRGVNVRVINNSFGGGNFNQAFLDLIDLAGEEGMLSVCAAGASGYSTDLNPTYPGCYESSYIINVASSDSLDRIPSYSNYGSASVDLAAPGVNIYTTDLDSYTPGIGGTSMAAAHVSGALALMVAADPALSPLTLKDTLLRSVEPIDTMSGLVLSGGRLDLANAVKAQPRTSPEIRAIGHTEGQLQFSWPTWAADFQLQETGELGSAAEWHVVAEAPLVQGDRYVQTLSVSQSAKFFRLYRP